MHRFHSYTTRLGAARTAGAALLAVLLAPTQVIGAAATGNCPGTSVPVMGGAYCEMAYETVGTYTFTLPAGVTTVQVALVGGGGGGGGAATVFDQWGKGGGGGGGGGGQVRRAEYTGLNPGETVTVVVGDGGAGGAPNTDNDPARPYDGRDGQDSTFTSSKGTLTGKGGNAGKGAVAPTASNGYNGGGGAGGDAGGGPDGPAFLGAAGGLASGMSSGGGGGTDPWAAYSVTKQSYEAGGGSGGMGDCFGYMNMFYDHCLHMGGGGSGGSGVGTNAYGAFTGNRGLPSAYVIDGTGGGCTNAQLQNSGCAAPLPGGKARGVGGGGGGFTTTTRVPTRLSAATHGFTRDINGFVTTNPADGSGAQGGSGQVRVRFAAPPPTTPGAPTITNVVRGDGRVVISFDAPRSDGGAPITKYGLSYCDETVHTGGSGDCSVSWYGFEWNAPVSSPLTLSGLTNGHPYRFKLYAYNSQGWGDGLSDAQSAALASPDSAYQNTWGYPSLQGAAVVPAGPPSAPTGVSVTGDSGNAHLTWALSNDNGSAITNYRLQYSSDGGLNWTDTVHTDTSTGVHDFSGLSLNKVFVFRVRATNGIGDGPWSLLSSSLLMLGIPDTPTIVSAQRGDTSALVTWVPPTSNGGANIETYTVSYDNGTHSGTMTVSGSETSTVVTGLTNGTVYTFKVKASNAVNPSGWSGTVAATPAGPPGPPINVTTSVPTAGSVNVQWSPPTSDNGETVTTYEVQYRQDTATAWTPWETTTTTSDTVTGLSPLMYRFQVRAFNVTGWGAWSESPTAIAAFVPETPTMQLALSREDGRSTLTWAHPLDNGGAAIDTYTVSYSVSGNNSWTDVIVSGSDTTTAITGLTNGTAYDFKVRASNIRGSGPYSAALSATPARRPDAPDTLTATRASTQVTLQWTRPYDGGDTVTGFVIQYSSNGGSSWTTAPNSPSASDTTTVVVGLTNGVGYVFQVRARNAVGNGAWSTSAAAIPATSPDTPSLTGTRASQRVSLAWTKPGNGGDPISRYRIQYREVGAVIWDTITVSDSSTSNPPDTSTAITGLTNGTRYEFQVCAINAAGSGAWSTTVYLTPATVPDTPTVAAVRGSRSAQLTITPAASNGGDTVTAYIVWYRIKGSATWTDSITATDTSTSLSNLRNGIRYEVAVVSVNAMGESPMSAVDEFTPAAVPGASVDTTRANTSSTSSTLTWSIPDNNGDTITAYVIEFSTDGGISWPDSRTVTAPPDTSTVMTPLDATKSYVFRVRAVNSIGSGATRLFANAPGRPTISATAGNGYVDVTWTAPISDGGSPITSYELSYYLGATLTTITVSLADSPKRITVANGATMVFWIVARNAVGLGPDAESTRVTPTAPPPSPSVPTPTPTPTPTVVPNTDPTAPVVIPSSSSEGTKPGEIRIPTTNGSTIRIADALLPSSKGIQSATLTDGNVTYVAAKGFSGRTTVPLEVTKDGVTTIVQVSVTVNPVPVTAAVFTPQSASKTSLQWESSPNAIAYQVRVNGQMVCSGATSTTCPVQKLLGPKAKIEVTAIGNDGTVSTQVLPVYAPEKPVPAFSINFDQSSSKLTTSAVQTLKTFVKMMKEQGFTQVVIEGHTDGQGGSKGAAALSAARAKSTAAYLSKFLNVSVRSRAAGEKEPVASNATKAGQAANRRATGLVR